MIRIEGYSRTAARRWEVRICCIRSHLSCIRSHLSCIRPHLSCIRSHLSVSVGVEQKAMCCEKITPCPEK